MHTTIHTTDSEHIAITSKVPSSHGPSGIVMHSFVWSSSQQCTGVPFDWVARVTHDMLDSTCTHMCTHTHAYALTRVHTHTHTGMHSHMYTCTRVESSWRANNCQPAALQECSYANPSSPNTARYCVALNPLLHSSCSNFCDNTLVSCCPNWRHVIQGPQGSGKVFTNWSKSACFTSLLVCVKDEKSLIQAELWCVRTAARPPIPQSVKVGWIGGRE